MGSEGRKEQGQTVSYKTNVSEQLHAAVVKDNAMVGKASKPRHMSVSHSTKAQAIHHIHWWPSRPIWRESKGRKESKILQADCVWES